VNEASGSKRKSRVVRGEGEVTQWPRGLVDYVPKGEPDATPSPEEDRTRNRLLLAARLLSLLRARGENVDRELAELALAQRSFAAGDRRRATELVDELLGQIDRRSRSTGGARSGPGERRP
jgi:hypothetical protein